MPSPQRIMIIGPSGAGKSTLARQMGNRLDLPVVHLDALFWQPGWVASPEPEFRARVAAAASSDAWVMDGNYTRTLSLRLPRTEAVIWLDLPRHVYFPRALWRSIRHLGKPRRDVGVGNIERFELSFFTGWVWTYPQRRVAQAELMANLPASIRAVTLRTPAQVRAFTQGLPSTLSP